MIKEVLLKNSFSSSWSASHSFKPQFGLWFAPERFRGSSGALKLPVSKERRAAFSLLELLVAITVLSLMMVLLSQVFTSVSASWTSGRSDMQNRRNIRAIGDFIGNELSRSVVPMLGSSASETQGNLQFVVNPPFARVPTTFRNADAVFWQAPIATESTFGELAVVGYFVQWRGGIPYLCRLFVNPSITENGVAARNPDYLVYHEADAEAWLSKDLLDRRVQPDVKASGYRGLFAENVAGFWVRCFDRAGDEIPDARPGGSFENRGSFDSRIGYDTEVFNQQGVARTEKRWLPASVEVSFILIDDQYKALLPAAQSALTALTSDPAVRSASDMMKRLETAGPSHPTLGPILRGVKVYTKQVVLECGR